MRKLGRLKKLAKKALASFLVLASATAFSLEGFYMPIISDSEVEAEQINRNSV